MTTRCFLALALVVMAALLVPGPGGARAEPATTRSAPAPAPATTEAARFESEAFAAVDAERWCEAMRLFEAAHALGPAVDLQLNAAQAAELAGDLEGARALLKGAIPALGGKKKTETQRRLAALQKKVAKTASAACPSLDALRPREPEPPPVSPEPTTTTASTTSPSSTSSSTTSTTTTTASPPAAAMTLPPSLPGIITVGVGGASVLVGGALLAVGLGPWFVHADTVARIADAESRRADATALQQEQARARADWEGSGQTLTGVGTALVAIGALVVGGGLVWALLPTPPHDATAAPSPVAAASGATLPAAVTPSR
jgi:hypothetical protein